MAYHPFDAVAEIAATLVTESVPGTSSYRAAVAAAVRTALDIAASESRGFPNTLADAIRRAAELDSA